MHGAAWSVSRASARPPPCGTVASPFGVVVAEALACQKAVVASAVGGIPEIIENGRSGVLVEPDHPGALARELLALLEDGSLRKSLGHAGYRESIFGAGAWKSSSVT